MIRESAVAGQFYPDDEKALRIEIEKAFGKELPCESDVIGGICPHAGYMFSGTCAAQTFKRVASSGRFDLFVILGFSHRGSGKEGLAISLSDWKTPLGIVKTDLAFAKAVKDISVNDEDAHRYEHSIEVQLPFLQYMQQDVRIAAISVSGSCDFKKLGCALSDAVIKYKKKTCILASSDFTHYGPSFGYTPFSDNIRENLKSLDMDAVRFIEKRDSKGFLSYIDKTGATICGKAPIALQIEVMKGLNGMPRFIGYCTSGEMTGDYTNSVSYVSLVYDKK